MNAMELRPITILAIDCGTVKCGWAVYIVNLNATTGAVVDWNLLRWGLEKGSADEERGSRTVRIATNVLSKPDLIGANSEVMVVVEEPPQTCYGGAGGGGIGRVIKMFQVFMLVGAVIGMASKRAGYFYRLIQPSQWQDSKKKRGGLSTKEWSVAKAENLVCVILKRAVKNKELLADDNVSDAINIGFVAVLKLRDRKWLPPTKATV